MEESNEKIYFSIREEIAYNQKQEHILLAFSYAIVGAVLSFSYQYKQEWAMFVLMLMIIPIAARANKLKNSIIYLSSYLRMIIEPKTNITWEKDHKAFQTKYKSQNGIEFYLSCTDYILLVSAVILTFWIIHGINLISSSLIITIIICAIQAMCFGITIYLFLLSIKTDIRRNNTDEKWRKLIK